MERFRIYMNPTRITEEISETLGWFYKSHHKFTLREEAHAKLTLQLDTDAPFDIHAHNVKVTNLTESCMKQKLLQYQQAKEQNKSWKSTVCIIKQFS
eukprot:5529108-Ditylum_brightwellii.AAC.1